MAKRQKVRKIEMPFWHDTALYIAEVIIVFRATFQLSYINCTLLHQPLHIDAFETISSGNNFLAN